MSAETWMEDRANHSVSFDETCSGNCETGRKESRLEDINLSIEDAVKRGLHMPISILAERDELILWLNENGECAC